MSWTIINTDEWNALHSSVFRTETYVRRIDRNVNIVILQNEAILAELQKRPSQLSPEDQEKLNQIFATATGDSAKLDAVNPPQSQE
jgi:hypothetical protein